jgi:hypothetical protein
MNGGEDDGRDYSSTCGAGPEASSFQRPMISPTSPRMIDTGRGLGLGLRDRHRERVRGYRHRERVRFGVKG